jgi:hypothetical protein
VGGRAAAGRGVIGRDREGTTLSGGEDTSTAWSRRRSVAGGQGGDEIGAGLGQDWDTGGRGARVGRVGQWWAWRRLMSCLHEQVPVAERAGHAVPQVRRLAVGQHAWHARRLGPMRPDNSRQRSVSACPACLLACLPACLLARPALLAPVREDEGGVGCPLSPLTPPSLSCPSPPSPSTTPGLFGVCLGHHLRRRRRRWR